MSGEGGGGSNIIYVTYNTSVSGYYYVDRLITNKRTYSLMTGIDPRPTIPKMDTVTRTHFVR